jgi:hypothetical protein
MLLAPLNAPETASAETVAGYAGLAPVELSTAKRKISAADRSRSFADG